MSITSVKGRMCVCVCVYVYVCASVCVCVCTTLVGRTGSQCTGSDSAQTLGSGGASTLECKLIGREVVGQMDAYRDR